jgi:hypothetical protein
MTIVRTAWDVLALIDYGNGLTQFELSTFNEIRKVCLEERQVGVSGIARVVPRLILRRGPTQGGYEPIEQTDPFLVIRQRCLARRERPGCGVNLLRAKSRSDHLRELLYPIRRRSDSSRDPFCLLSVSGKTLRPVDLAQPIDPIAQLGPVQGAADPVIPRARRSGVLSQCPSLTRLVETPGQRYIAIQWARASTHQDRHARQVRFPATTIMSEVKHTLYRPAS